ncbi:Acyl-coenzyme A thioesterase 11 [Larimichthys crocea]|uniref:Uncharacterized protein n=1 Tax=Larimichthys crocea TaxID=215358 RepID=A0ACD3QSH0_LARCR|nr:Acyl-coenzyme A thioesterase 11 [Larimichthys crocea]
MFPETARCFKTAAPFLSPAVLLNDLRRLSAHGGAGAGCPQARRHFSVSRCLTAKVPPPRTPRERVHIPGLERVTYGERMHYVPGLTKPVYPPWEKDYKDPRHYKSPPAHEMRLYKEKPCYVYNQRTSALEGVRQALWLTKTKLISGLPPQLLSLAENPANQIPDQDERVQNAIKHARFWDTTQLRPGKVKYSNTLLLNLLHLCAALQPSHPAIGRRILAEKYSLAATWKRGKDLFQIRGQNGLLHNSMDPLPEVSGKQDVSDTVDHIVETFYPVSPTIDLQKVHVYKEDVNCLGFRDDYPYPHAHTLYFLEDADANCKLRPEQFRAKMVMFAFGNALARAHKLYGVWLDENVELYDFAKVRPLIKKKQVKVHVIESKADSGRSSDQAQISERAGDQVYALNLSDSSDQHEKLKTQSSSETERADYSTLQESEYVHFVSVCVPSCLTCAVTLILGHRVSVNASHCLSTAMFRSTGHVTLTLKMSSRVSADLEREEEEDEEEEEEEEEEESVNPTEVKMSQIVMPCHSNHRQELSVGQLLKWIDSTACLSAERHAVCPCVTASMDDIHFEHTIRVGQVVNIKAKVNRAFNTSMEVGIQVSCEDLFSDRQWRVCHAYATFVTQRTSTGQKVVLKPIVPHTQREQVEYSVAAERRRVRMLHDDIIKDLLSNGSIQQGSRLCQAHPTLRAIDMFTFRGPSQIGDRLLLRAIVNNAFKNSIEVGVRAEAYQEEGANRHINSAFMTFEVLDNHGKPCTLPRIRPEPLEGERRFQEAIARKKIRLDRKYIISRKQGEVPLSVPWDPTNQVRLYTLEQKSMLSFRVEAEVDVPAHRAFCLLAELRNRPSWDTHYQKCELIHRVDDDDFLYRVVTPSVQRGGVGSPTSTSQGEGLLQDFILLACKRKPCGSGDPYVIALRSVSLPTYPPTEEINRGEVLCAGFTILETKNNMSLISYYNQASPEVLPYISTDIAGLSSSFYNTFCSCSQYLTKNRMQLASEHETDQDTNTDSPSCASVDDSLVVAISSTKL